MDTYRREKIRRTCLIGSTSSSFLSSLCAENKKNIKNHHINYKVVLVLHVLLASVIMIILNLFILVILVVVVLVILT